ncbi:UDP-N-acetylmuramate:L-alanyl-gamma-D-glutamyl-meso-diaminopimelate ligase [Marinospirillum perlucidum]|uniref:UDP-N-acetylmuramate:L-alanyl-gamma-D-glutamyl- meso-diaminopimelate ligase n=1 Tax=Marinospirillum perlucidum TaxID=1982602 RepID=UPI000DF2D4DF|nr:UDP-N-acetylmuramate:L-alanyl-gamma-D-glutamyl-meso-diaminopimelate ligase [Marinospirillum perlucidum]
MHLHFLGICGTFMGSLAILAREMGHEVSGSDRQVYPPMSDQLAAAGIELHQGFDYDPATFSPDLVIVGNVMRRGLPCVEALLNSALPYTSGPEWLHTALLRGQEQEARWVLAVAGTHGKTTTASMLAWILEAAGLNPGFLIGGVPGNFPVSARLGGSSFFVIEADEYDTAFFDKRSKFVHYSPRTLVMNNLEFDHADIFADLAAIQTQFHHLVRLLPEQGQIIYPAASQALTEVLDRGCWTPTQTLGLQTGDWQAQKLSEDASHFSVSYQGQILGEVQWSLSGEHNIHNALAAVAAARHVGILPEQALESLADFQGVKRRMEKLGEVKGIQLFDDFAHHPTAIATSLEGMKPRCQGRLLAVIEPRSNTMQLGTLRSRLADSVAAADQVFWYQNEQMSWSPADLEIGKNFTDLAELKAALVREAQPGDCLVLMSNGSFGGLHQQLLAALDEEGQA